MGQFHDRQLIIDRSELKNADIDIKKKTIIIGFNEPGFKKSKKSLDVGDMDAKLNARFITYFLPAIEIARKQKQKSRLIITSGLNMALKWSIETEEQKKIIIANNAIKIDFLKTFFETFFPDDFSLIEYVVTQDVLKISEKKLSHIWLIIEKKYQEQILDIKFQLTKFIYPKLFNVKTYSELSAEKQKLLNEVDAMRAFKYAIAHLFIFGDINLEGNCIHNPNGYVSIGGESELFFNDIRVFAYELLKDFGEVLFDVKLNMFDNYRIVLKNKYRVPPPYNGMWYKKTSLEVTYENNKKLCFYNSQEKLKDQMDYIYENLLSKKKYEKFWLDYKSKYFDLKSKYKTAYDIKSIW